MRILAFDQASKVSGWSFFADGQLEGNGIISAASADLGKRLVKIRQQINELIDKYNPDQIVFEDIQLQSNVGNNVVTYKALAEVLGVCEELASERKIPYEIIPALTWKSGVGIKGRTRAIQKENAQNFVFNTYGKKVTEDESDAICIGHFKSGKPKAKNEALIKKGFDWSI